MDETREIVGIDEEILFQAMDSITNAIDESCVQVAIYDDRLEVTLPGVFTMG